jgi:hypothetical protein
MSAWEVFSLEMAIVVVVYLYIHVLACALGAD